MSILSQLMETKLEMVSASPKEDSQKNIFIISLIHHCIGLPKSKLLITNINPTQVLDIFYSRTHIHRTMTISILKLVRKQKLSFAAKLTRILIKLNLIPVSMDDCENATFSFLSLKCAAYLFLTYLPVTLFIALFVFNHELTAEYIRQGSEME